jgi:heme/copper-type cytochrome/quinol oxidase subunit 2
MTTSTKKRGLRAALISLGALKENHPMNWRSLRAKVIAPIFAVLCLAAPAMSQRGWLLPEAISETAQKTDDLFWLIFWLVGIVFVGTEGLLIYFIIKYRAKEGGKAHYIHGNYKAELIWTATPAIMG